MDKPPPVPGKRSRSWPWLALALVIVLVPLVAVLAVFLNYQLSNGNKAGNLERQARAKKEPLTLQELMKLQPSIPDSENAAIALMTLWEQQDPAFWAAFNSGEHLLPDRAEEEVDPHLPYLGTNRVKLSRAEKLHEDARAAAETYLEEHAEYYRALEQALERPRSFFPEDLSKGHLLPLPHLPAIRSDQNKLRIKCALAIDQGRPEEAVENLKAMAAAGQTLKENQLLMDQLVRIACLAMVFEDTQRLLSQVPLNDAQLKELNRLFEQVEMKGAARTALVSERAMALSSFNMPFGSIKATVAQSDPEADPAMSELGFRIAMTGMKASGVAGADRRLMLETFDKALKLVEENSPEALREFPVLFNETATKARKFPPKIFSALLLPALERVSVRFATYEARRRAALTALAVERYRAAHGRLPESLSDIAPEFMAAVPADPFTGKPLLYNRLEQGYVIYSTGKDCVDDHGKERIGGSSSDSGYDEVFIVER